MLPNIPKDDVRPAVWVLADRIDKACKERLGDAARLAQSMYNRVGLLLLAPSVPDSVDNEAATLENETTRDYLQTGIRHGADLILFVEISSSPSLDGPARQSVSFSPATKARVTLTILKDYPMQLVLAGGDPISREWAATLAALANWHWVSPALLVRFRGTGFQITRIDPSGRRSCQLHLDAAQPIVATLREGVAEAIPEDESRQGQIHSFPYETEELPIVCKRLPVDPQVADIRDCKRLIAGGRGLGSAQGFALLNQIARKLDAGVAASRMAVDLGWVEPQRQVGQTGKTVEPDLYIACGISGASHHLDGMAGAKHIVAINTDPASPMMKIAHLKLAADLYAVLKGIQRRLEP